MDLLGAVPQDYASGSKGTVAAAVEEACGWLRRVRSEGSEWRVLPEPSVPELRPNMGNGTDAPWHSAKQRIAEELEEPTMLWHVGIKGRETARRAGVARWRSDPAFTAAAAGVTGQTVAPTLDAILDINRSTDGTSGGAQPRSVPERRTGGPSRPWSSTSTSRPSATLTTTSKAFPRRAASR